MFGTPRRLQRPVLLIIVLGMFLVIVGVTAMAQIVMVSAHFSTSTINSVVGTDAALVRMFVSSTLAPADLGSSGPTATRVKVLEDRLAAMVEAGEILEIEVRAPDGRVIAASRPEARGTTAALTPDFRSVLTGESAAAAMADVSASEAVGPALPTSQVLREYFPLVTEGEVRAVVGIWRDALPILAQIDELRRNIVLVTLSAAFVAAFFLYFVFRTAQARISRQAEALVDAVQRDTLTGRLNHGALVDAVAVAVERSKDDGRPFGIVLLDIDNFRLLNDNYGHAAADDALLTVVDVLEEQVPDQAIVGRYGPDELLVLVPTEEVHAIEGVLERVRAALVDHALQFEASERLPLTLSAGVCIFPDHADSVTGLLTVAALTLQEAKSSGGDAVRFADVMVEAREETRTFDVYQGLILAVDTKDRYTKRHSEDVARYGIFLAERLGLPAETIATVRVAGLLHDVGKIGIPDQILRKPGKLTEAEYAVVKQHVALGDMIVRDLPDVELIRLGVRHHHERWDGDGYLDRLAGEDIPLIARILAVGDAFSAMTTSRPYRKALDVREALKRLGDAAGTQLDERLVVAFIKGIETASDPPLPGADAQPVGLWSPYRNVA
jgi:diguanylate cyclase (GGDEF)-like protein